MSKHEQLSSGLIFIARDAVGQVITRLTCTRSREVISAMKSARSVLQLKRGAVRVEVHRQEAPISKYPGKPLAAFLSPNGGLSGSGASRKCLYALESRSRHWLFARIFEQNPSGILIYSPMAE